MKAQDRADLVQAYESVTGISSAARHPGGAGARPAFDAQASRARQEASKADLDKLAAAVSPGHGTIVVVGPRAAVGPQLAAAGLGQPELWDPEGFPLEAGPRKRAASERDRSVHRGGEVDRVGRRPGVEHAVADPVDEAGLRIAAGVDHRPVEVHLELDRGARRRAEREPVEAGRRLGGEVHGCRRARRRSRRRRSGSYPGRW